MRRVAITGVSGYIGRQLLARLDAHPQVEAVVGIDARPPEGESRKLRFFLRDITRPLDDLLARERVDAAVHLAFVVRPTRRRRHARLVNVLGTQHFIDACDMAGVGHVLYLGSASAYGAHPDNPVPLEEDSPLRPNLGFQYSRDKAETDWVFQSYAAANPQVAVAILRGCLVLGPGGADSVGGKIFRRVMLRVAGHDPPVQYLHEEDLMSLLVAALERRARGIFNIAGDGLLRYSDVARLARRPMVAMPRALLAAMMNLTWALGLQSESPAAGLDFIAYPWVASNGKLKRELGFSYGHSSEDAVRAYLQALGR